MAGAMKMLILHSELGVLRGGGENFTRNLFRAFAGRGHQVAAAFVAGPGGSYPLPLPPGIEAMPIPGWWSMNLGQATLSFIGRRVPENLGRYWNRFQQGIGWRVFRWHNRRFEKRIEAEFSRRWTDFDAIYVHSNPFLASKVARRRPTILRLPGPVGMDVAPELRSVRAVCANGDAFRQVRAFLGDHAIELPTGIDDRLFRPGHSSVRADLGWPEESRVVGYVGRLTHVKAVDLLAAVFSDLAPKRTGARLLLIGHGEEEKNIRSILAKELSRGLVHIEPGVNHEHLTEWYRAMDILVMPSRYENFSNAIIEAMACGVPFLASDVGGNRLLADTGAGWLFQEGSVTALTTALTSLIESRAELRARGAIGSRYARGHFSWDASAQLLEEIIQSRTGIGK
jgi:glycosyltransferase involved in cell wall biosynthesis